ncbi:MAG: hypothetical protein K8H88_01370 [Sandaracinaceae bacterium]|nr:hypothetical protein [Sandaracinaceae bacterium]
MTFETHHEAPDGVLFVTLAWSPPLGERFVTLAIHRGRWALFWCGRLLHEAPVAHA